MHIGNDKAIHSYGDFEHEVKTLLDANRESRMETTAAARVAHWLEENYTMPEEDIFWQLIPQIIAHERLAPKDAEALEEQSEDEPIRYQVKSFSEDGIIVTKNRLFVADLLPIRVLGDRQAIRKLMTKDPTMKEIGMSNAKPDFTYGIRENRYPDLQSHRFSPQTRAFMGVAPYMIHACFIIESKSSSGSLVEAENQACRGGATLVNARRQLNAKAGKQDQAGADRDSFVFSMTIDTNTAKIWVHWCELRPKSAEDATLYETYHMNKLFTCLLESPDMLSKLRVKLHNILDWGCLARLMEIQVVMDKIYMIEQAQHRENLDAVTPRKRPNTGR